MTQKSVIDPPRGFAVGFHFGLGFSLGVFVFSALLGVLVLALAAMGIVSLSDLGPR